MGQTFTIQEITANASSGDLASTLREGGSVFEWTNTARNIPRQPWTFGIEQRTARTDYPGSHIPTEQILGANFTPFTLEGAWMDKYNESGYAQEEQKDFEQMVRRGNMVRISFQSLVIHGIIVNAEYDYNRAEEIGYRFTVSPHFREKAATFFSSEGRVPRKTLNAEQLIETIDEEIEEMSALQLAAPSFVIAGSLYLDVGIEIDAMVDLSIDFRASISARFLSSVDFRADLSLKFMASTAFKMSVNGQNILDLFRNTRSDNDLFYEENVVTTLGFDEYVREMSFRARRAIVAARTAAADLQERVLPDSKALYTPQAGESLYSIANRFYNDPNAWRTIAERNCLSDFNMTGTELLILPEDRARL